MSVTVQTLKYWGKTLRKGLKNEETNSKPKKQISWADPLTSVKYFTVERDEESDIVTPSEKTNDAQWLDSQKIMNRKTLEHCSNANDYSVSQIPRIGNYTKALVQLSMSSSGPSTDEIDKLFTMSRVEGKKNLEGLIEEWV